MVPSIDQEIRDLHALFGSARDPQGRAFVALADAYRRAGDPARGLEVVDAGLHRHPDLASGHLVAAQIRHDLGDAEGAEGAYRRVLDLDGDNARALAGLGRLLGDDLLVRRGLALDPGLRDAPAPGRPAAEVEAAGDVPAGTVEVEAAGDVPAETVEVEAAGDVPAEAVDVPDEGAAWPDGIVDLADLAPDTALAPDPPADAQGPIVDLSDLAPSEDEAGMEVGQEASAWDLTDLDASGAGPVEEWSFEGVEIEWEIEEFYPRSEIEAGDAEAALEAGDAEAVDREAPEVEAPEVEAPEVAAPDVEETEVEPLVVLPVGEVESPILDAADLAPDAPSPLPEFAEGWGEPSLAEEEREELLVELSVLAPDLVEAPAPEPEAEEDPEAPVLVTRTLGEIYARQGLLSEAVKVFRDLVARDPDDAALRARLAELRAELDAGPLEPSPGQARPVPPAARPGDAGPRASEFLSRLLAWEPRDVPGEDE